MPMLLIAWALSIAATVNLGSMRLHWTEDAPSTYGAQQLLPGNKACEQERALSIGACRMDRQERASSGHLGHEHSAFKPCMKKGIMP